MAQRTGAGSMTVSPSMPTGISGVSASTVTSPAVSTVSPVPCPRHRSPAACRALSTRTATTPSVPASSRARRPRPAMSLISYGSLLTNRACGALDPGTCGPGGQPGAAVAGEQVGQRLQGGAPLVVPVSGAADHLGVGAERGVVDERAVGDDTQVDLQFLAVGKRVEAR
jgi:hypothetical protein